MLTANLGKAAPAFFPTILSELSGVQRGALLLQEVPAWPADEGIHTFLGGWRFVRRESCPSVILLPGSWATVDWEDFLGSSIACKTANLGLVSCYLPDISKPYPDFRADSQNLRELILRVKAKGPLIFSSVAMSTLLCRQVLEVALGFMLL